MGTLCQLVTVITFYSSSYLDQETAKWPCGHRVKLPTAHLSTTSGGFRGGDGGMHPPHQPKSNDFGRKIKPLFRINRLHFGMHPPPTDLNVTNPAKNQSQFW